jgi:hypothetical protein
VRTVFCVKKGSDFTTDTAQKRTQDLDATVEASHVARLAVRMNPMQTENTGPGCHCRGKPCSKTGYEDESYADGEHGTKCIAALTELMFLEGEEIDSINIFIDYLPHN